MCGITLIQFDKNIHLSKDYIFKFTKSLSHRGPDGINYYNDTDINLSIGHTRLKIIDTSDLANQPFFDQSKRFILSFNGEIFNYIELKEQLKLKGYRFKTQSDTEVLLYSYIEWGEECLFKFNGFWSFIIFDKLKKKFFISRDRFGVKPLYYYFSDNCFVVSSELKAFKILTDPINLKVNLNELCKLRKGIICEDTILKNVKMLLPGHNISYDLNNFNIFKWWETANHIKSFNKNKNYVEEFSHLLKDSCKLRLRSDVPLTTSLSGGLDSSSVVAEINQDYNQLKKHKSFFINYNYSHNEKKYVDALKYKYSLDINEIQISDNYTNFEELKKCTLYQETIGDDAIGPWKVYESMKQNGFKVSIDGHGPDELMGGYNEYHQFLKENSLKNFIKKIIIANIKKFQKILFKKNINNYSENIYFNKKFKNEYHNNFKVPENIKGINRVLYHDFHFGSLPLILEKFDKISMAHSVESREPFLDWRIVCLLFSLPLNFKFNKEQSKIILRNSMKKKLPEIILDRNIKKGFNQDNDMFNKTFKGLINDIIFSESFKNDELFNYKLIVKHINDKTINYKKLFRYIQAYFLKNNIC